MIGNRWAARPRLLLLLLGLLASCSQQIPQRKPVQSEIDEVHALVQAVKDNPSVKDPSQAGAPIQVDPYPKSAGAHHDAMNKMTL